MVSSEAPPRPLHPQLQNPSKQAHRSPLILPINPRPSLFLNPNPSPPPRAPPPSPLPPQVPQCQNPATKRHSTRIICVLFVK
ncbi:hypothetical protein GBA52_007717 [Prunus armeniaca]|nr:hypothetical protein GBA52_007717 [Prunus armeniaca]